MKIGILTFHRAINYGAFLQAFALRGYLTNKGHSTSIIDYWPKGHAVVYELFNRNLFQRISILGKAKYILYFILRYNRSKIRKQKMEELARTHFSIDTTPLYQNPNDLANIDSDVIIYGSDQIWWKSRIKGYEGFDWSYWGDYIPQKVKRISYAASMGVINLSDEDKANIQTHLTNFEKIAVRETELKDILTPLTDKHIDVVIDPVFLLNKNDWRKYMKPYKHPQKYVLLFNLMHSDEAIQVAKIKSKELGCEILEITSLVKTLSFGKSVLQTVDAFEFIYLIDHAEFVVTSSFHGTAFSIIFEKQFYALGMKNNSGRVFSLLTKLGISERLLTKIPQMRDKHIDYTEIRKRLEDFINHSKEYIESSLS